MSSRDFPVRQGVHLFFPTRVTPTPDYPFPPVANLSRTEPSGSSGVRDRAPAVRRRRVGRAADGSTFAFDPVRDTVPSRAQRTAEEMRSLYDDFYYNDNDHLGIDDVDTGRTPRSRTPQSDEDTEGARDRGENGFSAWIPRYRSPHPLQPPRQRRPMNPSVLSASSSAEILGGESSFPFPRTISVSRDLDRGSSSAFGAAFDDGNTSNLSGTNGPIDDREHLSNSGPMRRNPSSRTSLVDELALFRQQQTLTLSSTVLRRRAGANPDDPPAGSDPPGMGGTPGNRPSIRSLTIQAAPPLFSDVRRRRSVSDALLTRGDRGVADDTFTTARPDADEAPIMPIFTSTPEPPLTPQPPASLPMTRRRSRGRGGSSGALTPPVISRHAVGNGAASLLVHVPPRDWVFPIQEHAQDAQDSDPDNAGLPPLNGSADQNFPRENTNLTQPSDEIAARASQDVDGMSRLILEELDCDGEIA